jgi:hypothetical protein
MQECRERTIGVLLLLNRGRVGLTAGRLGKEEAAEHVIRRLVLVRCRRVAAASELLSAVVGEIMISRSRLEPRGKPTKLPRGSR